MTEAQAKALVATLAAAFPNQRIGQATLNVYALDLADLDFPVAQAAFESVRRGSKFMPTIAEIRHAAADLILGAPAPMRAFDQASTLPRDERHPLVRQARRMVGDDFYWRETPSGIARKAFLAAYEEIKAEAIKAIVSPALSSGKARALTSPKGELLPGSEGIGSKAA